MQRVSCQGEDCRPDDMWRARKNSAGGHVPVKATWHRGWGSWRRSWGWLRKSGRSIHRDANSFARRGIEETKRLL